MKKSILKGLRNSGIALLIFSGVFLCSENGLAVRTSLVADRLAMEGKEHYDRGSYEKAAHLFSQVLLIHPRDKEALEYLAKMGLKGGLYDYQRTITDHLYDLMEEISLYEQELQGMEEQSRLQAEETARLMEHRQFLEELIRQKEEEHEQLMDQGEEFYAVAVMKGKEIAELQEITEKKIDELVRLNTDLFETKQQWLADKKALDDAASELGSTKKDFKKYQKLTEKQVWDLKVRYEEDILALERRRDALEHDVFSVTEDRDQKIRRFQDVVRHKDAELVIERGRIAVASQQLAVQETQLLKAREQLDLLYTQREELVREADALEGLIRELRRNLAFRYARSSAGSGENLVDYVKKQDNQIAYLKRRMADLLEERDELRKAHSESAQQRAADLERQIRILEAEITDRERELEFSREQASSLESRVKDYMERLDIIAEMIEDKEDRILFLEKELGSDVFFKRD